MSENKVDQKRQAYRDAGVNVDLGDQLVGWLKDAPQSQQNKLGQVFQGIGGFAGLFKPQWQGIKEPILVACTDGVGTKINLALQHESLDGIGADLVAMCVNDLYCTGARPLFFLDYYATSKLNDHQFKSILTGIKSALNLCDCLLLGGETAELPGMYKQGDFDLAGFMIGVVDQQRILNPQNVRPGDHIYSLPSSGFHSNGYTLIRKWLVQNSELECFVPQLLEATRIYHQLPNVLDALAAGAIRSMAHITGGGISGNLVRSLPQGMGAYLQRSKIPTPGWMRDFLSKSNPDIFAFEDTFNMGVGMCLVVDPSHGGALKQACKQHNTECSLIGQVEALQQSDQEPIVTWVD